MSYEKGLVAGFGEPLGEVLADLKRHGVTSIRSDIMGRTVGQVRVLAQEAAHHEMPVLWIVNHREQLTALPDGCTVEVMNEPDLDNVQPEKYARLCREILHAAVPRDIIVWGGSISNLDEDSMEWLADVLDHIPALPRVSVHRYPHGKEQPFWQGHPGYDDRNAELDALFHILDGRPYLVSEVGYHVDANLTEDAQADRVLAELEYWYDAGAKGCYIYQLNDGPTTGVLDRYGMRRYDGTWRPAIEVFKEDMCGNTYLR